MLLNQIDIDALNARLLEHWTTMAPETAFADEIRWQMTAPEERGRPTGATRFGGGLRLSENRHTYIHSLAIKTGVDAVYCTFGKRNVPSMAYIASTAGGRLVKASCDFWLPEHGQLRLLARNRRSSPICFGLQASRLVPVDGPHEDQIDIGVRRARSFLNALQITRPGKLLDQHFFEDCSTLRLMREGILDPSVYDEPVSVKGIGAE